MQQFKSTGFRMLNSSNVRVILILAALVIAVMIGGAPHEYGGG